MMKRSSPGWVSRSLTAAVSECDASVSLATTRMVAIRVLALGRSGGDGAGLDLGRRLEDPVDGAGDPVLVRPADHGRDPVEVEDRRRGGDLPLEREGAPRVRGRARAEPPRGHDVVEEDERREPEQEGGDR